MSGDSRGAYISRIYGSRPVGFEQLTIDNTVGGKSLTSSAYENASGAKITVEAASLRFRIDGGDPTSTVGHLAEDTDGIELETHEEIENFKAIRTGSTSAVINVTYYE